MSPISRYDQKENCVSKLDEFISEIIQHPFAGQNGHAIRNNYFEMIGHLVIGNVLILLENKQFITNTYK
jgi:hypothetical protein